MGYLLVERTTSGSLPLIALEQTVITGTDQRSLTYHLDVYESDSVVVGVEEADR